MPQETKLYAGNDTDLVVNGLTDDSTGSYINDATIVCNVTVAASGATVAGGVNVSVPYVATSNGNYLGVLPSTASITAGVTYNLVFTASNYGLKMTDTQQAQVRRP